MRSCFTAPHSESRGLGDACARTFLWKRKLRFGRCSFESGDTKTEAQYLYSLPQRPKQSIPRAEKLEYLITAEHRVLNEGCESRNNHKFTVVVQDLAIQWIQSHPCKTKTSQETEKNLRTFREPSQRTKVIYTNDSLEFGKSCEEYHGIIEHLHLTDQKQAELQKELYVEEMKWHQPYCCKLDRMTSGGQISRDAIAICGLSRNTLANGKSQDERKFGQVHYLEH